MEPAVTVCQAACDYGTIWEAQYAGHRHLVLSGVLGPDVVTLPDTLIEGDGAILQSGPYGQALYVPVEAPRVTVLDLTFSRSSPDDGQPLVVIAAEDTRFERMILRNVASSIPADGDLIELRAGAGATLVDPTIEDNVGLATAPLYVGRNASLTILGGRIVGNRSGLAGVVYVDRGALTVEGTVLAPGAGPTLQAVDAEVTLTDVQGAGDLFVQGGTFTLRGGTWTDAQYLAVSGAVGFEIDGADVTAAGISLVGLVGAPIIHGATLRGLGYGGLSVWSTPSFEVGDTWFCSDDTAYPPLTTGQSCDAGCTFERVVVRAGSAGLAMELSGDVTLSHATVLGAGGPVVWSSGSLTLDRVLMTDHAAPAVTAERVDIVDSAFETLDGLDDVGGARAVRPVFRGAPVGPCDLDLQLADVPRNDWLIAQGVGAFPVCWTDNDGDGSGADLVDLAGPADACPAGTAPAAGDCDDTDPTLDRICDPPQPPPGDGGTSTRRSSRAGAGRCDTGTGPGGALAALAAFGSLLLGRRRLVR